MNVSLGARAFSRIITAFACASCTSLVSSCAASRVLAAPHCHVIVYPIAGKYRKTTRHLGGPGLLLDGGGTDVDAAWQWMHDRLTGSALVKGGNVVVLTADRDNAYTPWILKVARFASARTLSIPPCASHRAIDDLGHYIDGADAVFFAGGDQANYVIWKKSALIAAVRRVYARGGIVGGTSAGLAIQGEYVYDSVAADRLLPASGEVHTADAARNPFEPELSFTYRYFDWPMLRNTIVDTHFARRNRFGRLVAFMARLLYDHGDRRATIRGLGIDERSALVVNARGIATLLMQPAHGGYVTRGVYLLTGEYPHRLAHGKALDYSVEVMHVHTNAQRFDLRRFKTNAKPYSVIVNGTRSPFYNRNPYAR